MLDCDKKGQELIYIWARATRRMKLAFTEIEQSVSVMSFAGKGRVFFGHVNFQLPIRLLSGKV